MRVTIHRYHWYSYTCLWCGWRIYLFHYSVCNNFLSLWANNFNRNPKTINRTNIYYFKCREENQLDATECFIAIILCSMCFGHSYAHHQELETILVLLQHMVCNALVAGSRLFGVEQQAMCPAWGKLCDSRTTSLIPHIYIYIYIISFFKSLWL
jgi:hypothetical protein